MNVWIITPLVYLTNERLNVLEHGKVYSLPNSWASLIISEGVGAEYVGKITVKPRLEVLS